MNSTELVIEQTKKWIMDVVIGCNFCPFAAREVKQERVRYVVEERTSLRDCLATFDEECRKLDSDETIATTLIIMTNAAATFKEYLALVEQAEKLIRKKGYEGIYQVASFHPHYQFAGTPPDDPANFTNRSIYPMLHILREKSIEIALASFPEPERIPDRNIRFAREKGFVYMKMLRDACLQVE